MPGILPEITSLAIFFCYDQSELCELTGDIEQRFVSDGSHVIANEALQNHCGSHA
jgi:hypothetical protein